MKTNFDVCCESIETMAQIIEVAKCGWTKEQIINWLKLPFMETEEVRKLSICYLTDIPARLKNSRLILESMERGQIIEKNKRGFITANAEYRFIDCGKPEEYMGVYADQVVIDYREPMIGIAKILTANSCVPWEDCIIDDRMIGTSDYLR